MKSYDVCECGAPLRLMERPTPKPAGTEVLLKVIAAGVCHSDLHIWDGYYDLGGGKKLQPLPYQGPNQAGQNVACPSGRHPRVAAVIFIDSMVVNNQRTAAFEDEHEAYKDEVGDRYFDDAVLQ